MPNKHLITIILLSLLIMLYQGVFDSDAAIISQLTHQHGNNWLGPLSSALFYFGCGIASFYTSYLRKIQSRYTLFIGSFGYLLFASSGLIFIRYGFTFWIQITIGIIGFISGGLCSIFCNTQFNYVNTMAKLDREEIRYFGLNLAITLSSNIFGNLFSVLVIMVLGQFYTVVAIVAVIFGSSLGFLCFGDPKGGNSGEERVEVVGEDNNNIDSLLVSESADKDTNNNQQLDQKQQQPLLNLSQLPHQQHLPSPSPYLVCTSFGLSGINLAFVYCTLSILIYQAFETRMSELQLNRLTFLFFLFEGAGEFLGGISMVLVSPRIRDPIKADIAISIVFSIALFVAIMGSLYGSVVAVGIGSAMLGFTDCCCAVLGLSIAGCWKQKGIGAFSVVQNFAGGITMLITIFTPIYVSVGWLYLYCVCNVGVLVLYSRKQKQKRRVELIQIGKV